MKHSRLRRFLGLSIVAGGMLLSTAAIARTSVSVYLHNTSNSDAMTCQVHRVVTNTDGEDVETLLHTLSVKPKDERSARVRNRPQQFMLPIKHIARRIDRTLVYPRLKLTCELQGHNSKNHSPLWDSRAQSFSGHRFYGQCSPGRYCTARVQRK